MTHLIHALNELPTNGKIPLTTSPGTIIVVRLLILFEGGKERKNLSRV